MAWVYIALFYVIGYKHVVGISVWSRLVANSGRVEILELLFWTGIL